MTQIITVKYLLDHDLKFSSFRHFFHFNLFIKLACLCHITLWIYTIRICIRIIWTIRIYLNSFLKSEYYSYSYLFQNHYLLQLWYVGYKCNIFCFLCTSKISAVLDLWAKFQCSRSISASFSSGAQNICLGWQFAKLEKNKPIWLISRD